ncbi:hypothetical protein [Hyphomicrobium sp.]|uniref:hypothetical protein n=1 Tax=Hyphomicrobium sp. TaxID=82 RepID=UPI002E306C1B|nr:hypothetical protein [Hyphomicrobium sp.]HEX2843206.1 hypothetical protein [Hyphomicrobium sp.]
MIIVRIIAPAALLINFSATSPHPVAAGQFVMPGLRASLDPKPGKIMAVYVDGFRL